MHDSIDRVFVKAITTIRALSSRSNYGSLPRPPAENRIKLYGLYKQATEGDVDGIMQRPVGFSPDDEGAKKKWDAWKREEGLTKTEAKRHYISYLIDTMKVYASNSPEAKELLGELEYLWDQIKDLRITDDDKDPEIPLPSHSPSFSALQSDRYSTVTPSITNQQYRSNLQRIYSHSRKSTMSINDYVQQQRDQQKELLHRPGGGPGSTFSLPVENRRTQHPAGGFAPSFPTGNSPSLEDFRTWQGDINFIINKLSNEFLSKKRKFDSDSEISSEVDDPREKLQRRLIQILKFVGWNALRILKNFLFSVLALLFILWVLKKNVIVEKTLVKSSSGNGRKKNKELVINMVLNTQKNKWFIRLLNILNGFVGFV